MSDHGHAFNPISDYCMHCGLSLFQVTDSPDEREAACPGGPETNIRQISHSIYMGRLTGLVAAYRPPL
jgi:hypothetical protein